MTTLFQQTPIWLRRFAKLVAASTLFLIFAGAMVTSTGSGLAVPDWPLAYGMVFPPMIAGIFYEHGHRMVAAAVGMLTVVQAVWLHLREPRRFVRILGWSSVGAVLAQGLLGGLTVLFLLPHAISIGHAALGEVFLCLNMTIAFFTSKRFATLAAMEKRDAPAGLTTALTMMVYIQILAGALMRHLGAGLAIPDFPLAFGRLVPPMATTAIAVNFAHRLGALIVALLVLAVLAIAFRSAPLRRLGVVLAGLTTLQIYLGARVVWDGAAHTATYHSLTNEIAVHNAEITSLHVVTGAAILATSLLLALSARTLAPPKAEPAASFVPGEAAA